MKRLQIMIDEELDEALEREARSTGTLKAALIRTYDAFAFDGDFTAAGFIELRT